MLKRYHNVFALLTMLKNVSCFCKNVFARKKNLESSIGKVRKRERIGLIL